MQSSTTLGYAVATQDSIVLTRDRHWFLIGLTGPWNWMIYLFNMDISMHSPSSIQVAAARISGFSPNISGFLLPEKWSGAGCMSRVNIGFVVLLVHLSISRRSLKQARSMPEMGLEKARNVCCLEMGRVEHPQAQHLLRWWVIWVHSNSEFLPSFAPTKNGSSLMWSPLRYGGNDPWQCARQSPRGDGSGLWLSTPWSVTRKIPRLSDAMAFPYPWPGIPRLVRQWPGRWNMLELFLRLENLWLDLFTWEPCVRVVDSQFPSPSFCVAVYVSELCRHNLPHPHQRHLRFLKQIMVMLEEHIDII